MGIRRLAEVIRLNALFTFLLAAAGAAGDAQSTASISHPDANSGSTSGMVWTYKKEMLRVLVDRVPEMLKAQDPETGRWGKGIWMVNDQHPIYALAAAWAYRDPDNPYYHDRRLLDAVLKGGDALLDDADEDGKWVFRKKDGSTWGRTWMCWTYSRWMRSYVLVKEGMPPGHRDKWKAALTRAYRGIANHELSRTVNIPAHHAMGLYFAAREFGRQDWAQKATAHLRKTAEGQFPDGYWSEHIGPVIGYNMVYVEATGIYYSVSRDAAVLPSLERAARFHANFTYPDGSNIETVDERQLYHHGGPSMPSVGFSFTPAGRGYLRRQWNLRKQVTGSTIAADSAASFLLYGDEGPIEPCARLDGPRHHVTRDGHALVHGDGRWFVCLSGYCAGISTSRWIQDRQNLVSLFNADGGGLILGGGNTKLTPLWSTFTVGDINLLKHRPGDATPNFIPPPGLCHVPSESRLHPGNLTMQLRYGEAWFQLKVATDSKGSATLTYSQHTPTTAPAAAHMPFFVQKGKSWSTASGRNGTLNASEEQWKLGPGEAGEWFQHAGWRVSVPPSATIEWPVTYHNQYAKYGETPEGTGAIVMTLPFDAGTTEYSVTVGIP